MNKKQNRLATPTEQRLEQEQQTNEALLAEDAVQTTVYLANWNPSIREVPMAVILQRNLEP